MWHDLSLRLTSARATAYSSSCVKSFIHPHMLMYKKASRNVLRQPSTEMSFPVVPHPTLIDPAPLGCLAVRAVRRTVHQLHSVHLTCEEKAKLYRLYNRPHGHGQNHRITVSLFAHDYVSVQKQMLKLTPTLRTGRSNGWRGRRSMRTQGDCSAAWG